MDCQYCINKPKKANYIVDSSKYICKTCIDVTVFQNTFKTNNSSIEYIQAKQVNRYNLPLDHKYRIIGFDYCGSILDGGGSTCDNCNRIIVNIATVETEEGKRFDVGLDCAETLSLVDCSDFWKIKEQEALHRKLTSYIRTIKKQQEQGIKVSYEPSDSNMNVYIHFWSAIRYRVSFDLFNKYFKPLGLPLKTN